MDDVMCPVDTVTQLYHVSSCGNVPVPMFTLTMGHWNKRHIAFDVEVYNDECAVIIRRPEVRHLYTGDG